MIETSYKPGKTLDRFPLSFTQEYFCSMDKGERGGAFGHRFLLGTGIRIAGRVDVTALQGALDDVVARHEILRSVVVRGSEPPYQQVCPPCPVPLRIQDLASVPDGSRDLRAEELIFEEAQAPMNTGEPPLLRAVLSRFDDCDSVLVMMTHHSACDGWSMQLIMRDLAAFYAARTSGRPLDLPKVRQYREYAAWQRAGLADPASDEHAAYWRQKLAGARVFALPNDHAKPPLYTRSFSMHNYSKDDVVPAVSTLAAQTRSSLFMVLLAAFNVLAYQITGTTDPVLRAFTTGRDEPEFHNTVGPFLNVVPFRTSISKCATFREIVTHTRDTCVEAYTHEIPITQIERALPDFNKPHQNPRMSQIVLEMFQAQVEDTALQIADGSYEVVDRQMPEPEHPDIPDGLVWDIAPLPSGELTGGVLFNLDEFDERTVVNWVSEYQRIVTMAVNNPDQDWKTL